MSDDYDEFDLDFDSAFLQEIDAIEAASSLPPQPSSAAPSSVTGSSSKPAHAQSLPAKTNGSSNIHTFRFKPASASGRPGPAPSIKPKSNRAPPATNASFDEYDTTFNIDESDLARLDEFIADSYAGKAQPQQPAQAQAGPSRSRQTTLDGSTYNPSTTQQASRTSSGTNQRTFDRSKSTGTRSNGPLFGYSERRTKVWDRTQFAETGFRSKPTERQKEKEKEKGKEKENMDEVWDEEVEFEQFPARKVASE